MGRHEKQKCAECRRAKKRCMFEAGNALQCVRCAQRNLKCEDKRSVDNAVYQSQYMEEHDYAMLRSMSDYTGYASTPLVSISQQSRALSLDVWDNPLTPQTDNNTPQSERFLACPFFKHDPFRYSIRDGHDSVYKTCGSAPLKNFGHVKQHFLRVHARPTLHCPRCWCSFETQADMDDHICCTPACELRPCPYPDKLDSRTINDLEIPNKGAGVVARWYALYSSLFPNSTPPRSPWQDPNVELVHSFAQVFSTLGVEESARVYRLLRENAGLSTSRMTPLTWEVIDRAYTEASLDSVGDALTNANELEFVNPAFMRDGKNEQTFQDMMVTHEPWSLGAQTGDADAEDARLVDTLQQEAMNDDQPS